MAEFLHMGGYAFYVWSAYGIALGTMLLLPMHIWCKQGCILKKLKESNAPTA